jgi:hypothetical protein
MGGGSEAPVADAQAQRAAAEAMVGCLADADVTAETRELGDDARQLTVLPEEGGPLWQLCWVDGCTLGGGQDLSSEEIRSTVMGFEELGAAREPAGSAPGDVRWVIVEGVDRTDAWLECSANTGYSRPESLADPTKELQEKAAAAAAGAEWAACARENGYPAARDPDPPVADNWDTYPSAVLPGEITPDQLRTLVAVCPTFDSAARAEADRAQAEDPDLPEDEYWRIAGQNPDIAFELPCPDGASGNCEEATLGRELALYQVLEEEQNRYLRELNASQDPTGP